MYLRAELLRTEQHQAEVAAALRDVEQHLLDVRLGSSPGRVLVELVDEHDDGIHAQLTPLELLAQPRDDAGEDEILSQRIHVGDIDDVDGAVFEPVPGKIAGRTIVGHESLASRGNTQQAVAHLAYRSDVMGPPGVAAAAT